MIKIYTGPMFSGKSTALLLDYNMINGNKICFKPCKDKRDKNQIKARNVSQKIDSIVIKKFEDILEHITEETEYIFIDEVQFIEGDYNILTDLSLKGINIIMAGLKQKSDLKPFNNIGNIICLADEIIVLKAVCEDCGGTAQYTYRLDKNNKADLLIGDKEKYIPLCIECYRNRMK